MSQNPTEKILRDIEFALNQGSYAQYEKKGETYKKIPLTKLFDLSGSPTSKNDYSVPLSDYLQCLCDDGDINEEEKACIETLWSVRKFLKEQNS